MKINSFRPWALIMAAGAGTRLQSHTQGKPKQFLTYKDTPLYLHSAQILRRYAALEGIIFVFPKEHLADEEARLHTLEAQASLGLRWQAVAGGERRQDSVRHALQALPMECSHVLVHDAARPFVTTALVERVCAALKDGAEGAVPGLPMVDTVKVVHEGEIVQTPDRNTLFTVQTPQGFQRFVLQGCHAQAEQEGWDVTDDASLLERAGRRVALVTGEAQNMKITHAEDLDRLESAPAVQPCSGFGYDVHRFGTGEKARPLKLGGVVMDGGMQVLAHSDGDVLLHALMDALLGAAALGDIGQHFPDSKACYDNADSAVLLQEVLRLCAEKELAITHVDLTIICQKPKVGPQRGAIQKQVAHLLALPTDCVNAKATTEEGLGFTGSGEGIKAVALVQALKVCR